MAKYDFVYATDDMLKEVDDVLKSEHGLAVAAYCMDCGRAAVKSYKAGVRKSIICGALLGIAASAIDVIVREVKERKRKEMTEEQPKE